MQKVDSLDRDYVYEQIRSIKSDRWMLCADEQCTDVQPDTYHLIVGLGVMGCDALLEVKTLIKRFCRGWQDHVAFLGFDLDRNTGEKADTWLLTGNAAFDDGEFVFLEATHIISCLFENDIEKTFAEHPEYFDWVDETMSPEDFDYGPDLVRQVGRLALHKHITQVRSAIREAVLRLMFVPGVGHHAHLHLHILSGLWDGTGGSMIIDMPYIIRDVLKEIGDAIDEASILHGYLFLPETKDAYRDFSINLETRMWQNTYAALQELDWNLDLHAMGEEYTTRYPGGTTLHPGVGFRRIFDFVHVSPVADGSYMRDPWRQSMSAAAWNILSFIANGNAADEQKDAALEFRSYYSNIDAFLRNPDNGGRRPHRSRRFIAIDSYSYDLPVDAVMMYVAGVFFERIQPMTDVEPNDEDVERMLKTLYLDPLFIVIGILTCVIKQGQSSERPWRMYSVYDWDDPTYIYDRFADNSSYLESALDEAQTRITHAICRGFDIMMKAAFQDAGRGPVYANRLIKRLLEALEIPLRLICEMTDSSFMRFCGWKDGMMARIVMKRYKYLYEPTLGRVILNNESGEDFFNKCVECGLQRHVRQVLLEVWKYFSLKNDSFFKLTGEVLTHLTEYMKVKTESLADARWWEDAGDGAFDWQPLTIPRIQSFLRNRIGELLDDPERDPVQCFLRDFWQLAQSWTEDVDRVDLRSFLGDFFNGQFHMPQSFSIEDVVLGQLAPDQTLEDACNRLIRRLEWQPVWTHCAQPDTIPHTVVKYVCIPRSCPAIFDKVSRHFSNDPSVIVQKGDIHAHIHAQVIQIGVTLGDCRQIRYAESILDRTPATKGLHLVDPHGRFAPKDAVSWTSLPTLIPCHMRSQSTDAPWVARAVDREDATKARFKGCVDPDTKQSRSPALVLDTLDALSWEARFILTDVDVIREGDVLRLTIGGRTVAEFDLRSRDGTVIDDTRVQLRHYLDHGLQSVDGAHVHTREIRLLLDEGMAVRDPALALEYMAEEYLRRICLIHAFERELDKYDTIRRFIGDL